MLALESIEERRSMVETQIAARGVRDVRVLRAMESVPRERFLPADMAAHAFEDRALPVGMGQTISQPYIVGMMTESLRIEPAHRVLEIGTGTGYQTAVLALLARHVYTVERIESLSQAARPRIAEMGLENVIFLIGDGSGGWSEHAPYDRIIVTAAAPSVIPALVEQLVDGGRLIMPIGDDAGQMLVIVEKHRGRTIERPAIPVRFVRLIGDAGFSE